MSIRFQEVNYQYLEKTPFAYLALKDINLQFEEGKITAIIGATGSGKTTLVQHLNALLLPTSGEIEVANLTIKAKEKFKKVKELRKNVGLVFQFAEYQLFEETVIKDVAFGPKNFGVSEQEATKIAYEALLAVGIETKDFEKSPLELSGGQKRRVAIAGILAMKPQVLVLDEPTAGLDPQGATAMMDLFKRINQKQHITIIIVTHNMEHVLSYCDRVVTMEQGSIVSHTDIEEFINQPEYMERALIDPPIIIQFKQLCHKYGVDFSNEILTIDELVNDIVRRHKQ